MDSPVTLDSDVDLFGGSRCDDFPKFWEAGFLLDFGNFALVSFIRNGQVVHYRMTRPERIQTCVEARCPRQQQVLQIWPPLALGKLDALPDVLLAQLPPLGEKQEQRRVGVLVEGLQEGQQPRPVADPAVAQEGVVQEPENSAQEGSPVQAFVEKELHRALEPDAPAQHQDHPPVGLGKVVRDHDRSAKGGRDIRVAGDANSAVWEDHGHRIEEHSSTDRLGQVAVVGPGEGADYGVQEGQKD